MSTKDISRFLFQPRKHYVGMRMQQGRVTLDSDHNEGAWHDDEDQRRTLLELIGPQGSPDGGFFIGYTTDTGFAGTPQPISVGVNPGTTQVRFNNEGSDQPVPNYWIMPGTMVVGGLRVEIEEPEPIVFQSDYLQNSPILGDIPSDLTSSSVVAHHFFFLNVWEQCVTAVEDEEFLERALGGPDTSVRVRRMRRVEYLLAHDDEDCITALERALNEQTGGMGEFVRETGELRSPGRLLVEFAGGDTEDTCAPCHPDPTGRYLGAENQAIRIMLVDATHFVWAYDNASPLYRVTIGEVSDGPTSDPLVTMLTLPKDEEHWPLADRVVEILPWSAILDNGEKVADEIGVFCRVSKGYTPDGDDTEPPKTFRIDRTDSATMAALNDLIHAWDNDHPRLANLDAGSEPRHFYVRFWHQVQTGTTPVLIPTSSAAPLGSTGIVPNFREPGLRGDFWIAALRPETPDRVVPFDLHTIPNGVPPHGPRHFYSPLAMIDHASNVVTGVEDCRKHIVPVTDQGCCTVIVGDGVHSVGQYTSIQAAINALPPQGGEVCIRPGLYREEIIVTQRNDVVLVGCGDQTIIESPVVTTADALVEIAHGQRLTVSSLTLRATRQRAMWAHQGSNLMLKNLKVEALVPADNDPDDEPVVLVEEASPVLVQGIEIKAAHRTGLFIQRGSPGDFVRVIDALITATAPPASAPAELRRPTGPLVRANNADLLFEDWRLKAYGQVGIEGEQLTLRMKRVRIEASHFASDARARSALDLTHGTYFIDDCRFQTFTSNVNGNFISEDATVVVFGLVTFENNEIVGSGNSWGGLQIRGGDKIIVRKNLITSGAGHGITLGGALWTNTTNAQDVRRFGAGAGQMVSGGVGLSDVTGSLRNGFTQAGILFRAAPETPLGELEIVENRIEFVAKNGISVLTLLGWPTDVALPALNRTTRISRNTIRNNVIRGDSIPLAEPLLPVGGSRFGSLPGHNVPLRMLPLGGIILGGAAATSPGGAPFELEIHDNVIEDNGSIGSSSRVVPVSGIFVLAAPSITISGNRIARNGFATQPADVLQTGIRAGIAVLLAGAPVGTRQQIQAFLADTVPRAPGTYALKVSNNAVEQPEGRALFAVGTGPMSIEDNYFSSLGFHGSTASPEALADIFAVGDVVYVHNLGRPWEAFGLPLDGPTSGPPANNSFAGGQIAYLKDALNSFGSYTVSNLFFVGLGGQTQFSNNQVVYDWTLQRVGTDSLSFAPVTLVSLDHVLARANQIAFRLQTGQLTLPTPPLPPPTQGQGFGGRPVLTHVLAVGYTVDVSGNRVSEGLDDCEASIFSIGFAMNSTTGNIGTHCIISKILTSPDWHVDSGNIPLLRPSGGCLGLAGALDGLTEDLSLLLEDRRS